MGLLCNVSVNRLRPLVPAVWSHRVFDAVHSLSHPEVKDSIKLVGARFVWPSFRKNVSHYVCGMPAN